MIGAPIGHAIGAALQSSSAFTSTLTANAAGAGVVVRSAGKFEIADATGGASVKRSIAAMRKASGSATGSVVRAASVTVVSALGTGAAVAVKNIGKIATAAGAVLGILGELALNITSTLKLHKPVDYFMANLPQYRDRFMTREGRAGVISERTSVTKSGVHRSGVVPSFTSKTNNRGYD